VGERQWCLAPDDRRRLVDEVVVLESLDHEKSEVDPACQVAFEDRVAYVSTPNTTDWP
jgi:hypothetical protein